MDTRNRPAEVEALLACARPGIRSLAPYQPGKPIEELERELGLTDIIKLASNENPLGPGARAREAAEHRMVDLGRYPDGGGFALKQALARFHDVPPDMLTLGNGSNEVLEFVARVFAGPGDEVLFSEHCFVVYPISAIVVGATPVAVPAKNFGFDVDGAIAALTERTRVVFVANPNNPTGTWINESEVRRLLDAVPRDCVVVLDEAYYEYARRDGYPEGTVLMAEYPNLVVTRTFSKVHGLASTRIGYGLSDPGIADLMNRIRMPFNVNDPSMAAAIAALDDPDHVAASVALNAEVMQAMEAGFERLGLAFIPSIGNFVTFDTGRSGAEVYEALLREGVIVRPIGGYGLPRHLRVSVGTAAENARFLEALERVLGALPPADPDSTGAA